MVKWGGRRKSRSTPCSHVAVDLGAAGIQQLISRLRGNCCVCLAGHEVVDRHAESHAMVGEQSKE